MTHIFSGDGKGKSRHSLTDAIMQATSQAMAAAQVNADHQLSLMVIVDGYVFDGENYVAKVRVSVLDYDLEQQDYFHEHDKELEDRRETSAGFSNAFFASALGSMHARHNGQLYHNVEQMMERGLEQQNGWGKTDDGHLYNLKVYAHPDVHDRLGQEFMAMREENTLKQGAPSLDLGPSGSGHSTKDEAA